ncbi:hypothetical protein GCM10009706_14590 [Curtobacterium citreum]|uniref:DUF2188 domain-containing protein n=1 Tax=Curtobacterium citreum TaxID=2036 RepID=A0ABT2HDN4_9MICO|nr:DUF2188 domain-containing protein [Curtobacterium citreum]MCS6521315.1 DUF2188 domain-containing protein [Curtobacterium citreum]TQJ28172.1 uncharacterized protein DUF2188 [Curtobacterium citreum]GGL77196.1 hypothetical protein GCM10009706_14590 [Curtobacterium citreum]
MPKGNDNDRYVVPNNDRGGWDVKKENAQRASAHARTQAEAEARAKEIAENAGGGDVRVQRRDGRWRDSDTTPSGNESRKRDTKH